MWFGSTPPPPPPATYKGPPLSSAYIFTAIAGVLLVLYKLQNKSKSSSPRFLPPVGTEKRSYELWVLKYSVVWMGTFGVVIAFQIYEYLDALGYFVLCGGLALPLLLQPLLSGTAPHAARAQLWIAIFGFIGNYWYTHYFYCVLRANYTMPAWRLNDVPIAMYSATHFYFSSYHVFANLPMRHVSRAGPPRPASPAHNCICSAAPARCSPLRALCLDARFALARQVRTAYAPGAMRNALEVGLVLAMSYATAFMETLTISNFPYYDFEDRDMAYTVGSAFYGLYFVVSFPVYLRLDEAAPTGGAAKAAGAGTSLLDAAASSLASGMAVLMLLDLTRLAVVGTPLTIGGKLVEITHGG